MYNSVNRENTHRECKCWQNKGTVLNVSSYDELYEYNFNNLCQLKNMFINFFIEINDIQSVSEIGCGDGNRSLNGKYNTYYGYDKSKFAINMANITFGNSKSKIFSVLDKNTEFVQTDLSISLDILSNIEKEEAVDHIMDLVNASKKYIIIYVSTNVNVKNYTNIFGLQLYNHFKKNMMFDGETICSQFFVYKLD